MCRVHSLRGNVRAHRGYQPVKSGSSMMDKEVTAVLEAIEKGKKSLSPGKQ